MNLCEAHSVALLTTDPSSFHPGAHPTPLLFPSELWARKTLGDDAQCLLTPHL